MPRHGYIPGPMSPLALTLAMLLAAQDGPQPVQGGVVPPPSAGAAPAGPGALPKGQVVPPPAAPPPAAAKPPADAAKPAPPAAAPAPPPPPKPPPPPPPPMAKFRGALEGGFSLFPSGTHGGALDFFFFIAPMLGYDAGDDFGLELGAPLNLRLIDAEPFQRGGDIGGILRRQDWDETSDLGQIVRELRIFADDAPFTLRAGPVETYSMGAGHLIHRYSNQRNPNYHPSAISARAFIGPTRTELFASDFLGARILAGEFMVDLGRVLGGADPHLDRYHMGFSAAHDFGIAGGRAPGGTLMHLDADVGLVRTADASAFIVGGLGTRVGQGPALGALIGLVAEGRPGGILVGGRVEARKQGGPFRQGYFGPQYELSRFAGVGENGLPLGLEQLPDSFSGYGELAVSMGPELPSKGAPRLFISVGGEYFSFGRTDLDVEVTLRTMRDRLAITSRVTAVGVGLNPRFGVTMSGRFRFASSLYALASGGTADFPQADSTLARSVFVSLGLGVDFER